jgi:hypothetical protein
VGGSQELVEVLQAALVGVDAHEVSDVIAVVAEW